MDISLVPIEELYKELLSRFDHAVFMGKKINGIGSSASRRWIGDPHMAMGLCNDLSDEILSDLIREEDAIEPKDL